MSITLGGMLAAMHEDGLGCTGAYCVPRAGGAAGGDHGGGAAMAARACGQPVPAIDISNASMGNVARLQRPFTLPSLLLVDRSLSTGCWTLPPPPPRPRPPPPPPPPPPPILARHGAAKSWALAAAAGNVGARVRAQCTSVRRGLTVT